MSTMKNGKQRAFNHSSEDEAIIMTKKNSLLQFWIIVHKKICDELQ